MSSRREHHFDARGICTLCGRSKVAIDHFGWAECADYNAQPVHRTRKAKAALPPLTPPVKTALQSLNLEQTRASEEQLRQAMQLYGLANVEALQLLDSLQRQRVPFQAPTSEASISREADAALAAMGGPLPR